MTLDLSFVQYEVHRRLLRDVLERACSDPDVRGVLLEGSVARGDARPGSDLDVFILLRDGRSRTFQSAWREGILVECTFADSDKAKAKLEADPTWVYAYLDGRILHDPQGGLAQLVALARTRFETYRASPKERESLAYWLDSAGAKIAAARESGDLFRAAYVAGATLWPILEAVWAANDKPVPPCGSVWAHVGDLNRGPPDPEARLRRLFVGDDGARVQAAVEVIEWAVPVLRGAKSSNH
jgi:predicted nucleotidyltransferase